MTVKEQVLRQLEERRGEPVAGQELADSLGVSRTAIWKAIRALEEAGHQIQSGKRGYTLAESSDLLSEAGIRQYLTEKIDIRICRRVDSTNLEAKRLAAAGVCRPTLIAAEEQTAGRGRLGRAFYSPQQSGCYFTLLLQPNTALSSTVLTTVAAAVAVCRAVKICSGAETEIKWVNDIYLNGKKLCGILTEAITDFESQTVSSLIIGIGINTGALPPDAPPEVREIAVSLYKTSVGRNRLIAETVNELLSLLQSGAETCLPEYRARSFLLGREITYRQNGVLHSALAKDIADDGGLIVLENGQPKVLNSGEVSVKPKQGEPT